jgi:hypothetical protein
MFSLSGVSAKFSSLWGERRYNTYSLTDIIYLQIPINLFILQNNFDKKMFFFVTHCLLHKSLSSWVCPDDVTYFDTSHCYWLPVNFLLDVVTSMKNLNLLCIQDTKLNLSHLGQIFKKSHLIEKISISLSENDGDIVQHHGSKYQLRAEAFKALSKLTHMKILAFNAAYYLDSWLLILQLFR